MKTVPGEKLADLMSMDALSKIVHMNNDRLRRRCIVAGIAVRWGGTDKHPILKARLCDVEAMILGEKHLTRAAHAKVSRRACSGKTLSKLVTC